MHTKPLVWICLAIGLVIGTAIPLFMHLGSGPGLYTAPLGGLLGLVLGLFFTREK